MRNDAKLDGDRGQRERGELTVCQSPQRLVVPFMALVGAGIGAVALASPLPSVELLVDVEVVLRCPPGGLNEQISPLSTS